MEKQERMGWRFWAGCILLALSVRAVSYGPVYRHGEVQLVGTDPYYHLRRILHCVQHFPHLPGFDPYLGHPYGALNPYEPGFDLTLATLCRIWALGGVPTEHQVMALCAGIMPLLGLLALPLYAAIARRLAGVSVARAVVVLMAILPGVAFTSQLGQVDHHVLEPLVIGLPMLLVLDVLEAPGRWRAVALAGLTLGGGLFFWRGMLLPAAILAGAFALRGLWQALHGVVDELTRLEAPFMFAAAGAVALPIGMSSPVQERLSYFTISLLQPLGLSLLALALFLLGRVFALAGAAQRRQAGAVQGQAESAAAEREGLEAEGYSALAHPEKRRAAGTAGLLGNAGLGGLAVLAGVGPFLAAGALLPTFGSNLLAGMGFLARADAFVLAVGEQRPLFMNDDGGYSLLYPVYFYGAFFFLGPILAWLGWQGRPARRRNPHGLTQVAPDFRWLLFVLWSLAELGLAVTQRRYAAQFAPLYAVWLGMGLAVAWPVLRARGRGLQTVAAVAGTLLLLPTVALTATQAGTPVQEAALLEAMRWLRYHTPPTASFELGAREGEQAGGQAPGFVPPEYGVLASWDEGHHLISLAHRPNVANPFGIEWFKAGLERSARFWLASGDELGAAMDDTGAQFALVSFRLGLLRDEASFLGQDPDRFAVRSQLGWKPGRDFAFTGSQRLYLEDGLARGRLPPVKGVRLVWEGGQVAPTDPAAALAGVGAPVYKIFERVAGARFAGQATPGSQVIAGITVLTPAGRRFQWGESLKAGADGHFELEVPYASSGVPAGWARATGPLIVRWDGREWQGPVADADVRSGGRIELEAGLSAVTPLGGAK